MGPGLLESVYQECMEAELNLRGVQHNPLQRVPLVYKGKPVGEHLVMDLFFPDRLVVELKAVERLIPVHEAQLLTYLRLSRVRVGLLINFNVPILVHGVKRLVLGFNT
jgi:GxxExxY protein